MTTEVGFIGLGNMGRPMATNVLKAGFPLTVHDIVKEAAQPLLEMGARWAGTPKEVAQASRVVVTSLPGPAEVELVALGKEGILAGARQGDLYIDMSTNRPATISRIAQVAKERGVEVIEAPVTGAVRGARKGSLTIIVGGEKATFERARPVLSAMGTQLYHVGPVGTGNVAKLANNLMALSNALIAMEAMVLGVKGGLDPKQLFDIVDSGSGTSWIFKSLFPFMVFKGRFDPPAFRIDLAIKDLQLALASGEELSVPMPVGKAALDAYQRAAARGLGGKDVAAAITLLEESAGVTVRAAE